MRLLFAILLAVLSCAGQNAFYPFAIDQDGLTGAPDFSFLNHAIGPADRIFVRDGHFFRVGPDLVAGTGDDTRVAFFGVNLAYGANFPEEKDAVRIAHRLRRLGINLVRLHHMDSLPDNSASNALSILMAAPYPTLNGVAVQRLRTFLSALAADGIYCNLNLHVGYTFDPARDQVPSMAGGAPMPDQSKPLHIFYPRMVELQTKFTRDVIAALALRDDPVLAMVEINNESSMLQQWQWSNLDKLLTGEYRSSLQGQWNDWLLKKYGSTVALREAWTGSSQDGPELLKGNWTLEVHSPAQAVLTQADGVATVQIRRGGAPVIAKQVGFSMSSSQTYLAAVEMRADLEAGQSRTVYFDVKEDVSPWRTAMGGNVQVTNQWQRFTMLLKPQFDMSGTGRLGLSVEALDAPIQIRNASIRSAGSRGLADGESLEDRTVSLLADRELATQTRGSDYVSFLAGTDKSYLDTMLSAVRGAANPLTPVAGTQMGYGGLKNIETHASLDFQDNHFYIDHYDFPNVPWDGRDWRIRDSSSIGAALETFLNMASSRQAGRPFTLSEYNQPWPNTYSAEIDPTLAVFGAFQDWDSIVHFAYSHDRNWDAGVPAAFNLVGDWTKVPNIGQSAWMFRSGAIRAGLAPVNIPVSAEWRQREVQEKWNGGIAPFLAKYLGYAPETALAHPVRLAPDLDASLPDLAKAAPVGPSRSDTAEFTFDKENKQFLIHAEGAAGVYGFVRKRQIAKAGPLTVEPMASARGYVAILVTPLDGRPIANSERMLLSNPGYALRSQPGTTPASPQRIINYPATTDWWTVQVEPNSTKPSGNLNGGNRPVWLERVEARVTINSPAQTYTVYPLDGAGRRLSPLGEGRVERVEGGIRIHLQADGDDWSPWYEIVRE